MTVSARIRTAALASVVRVPNAALHFSPPERAVPNGSGVWVLDGTQLRYVPLKLGISDGELTEVLEGGLVAPARVVVELTAEGRTAYGIAH
jgi:HlyD family secretion protein